MNEQIKNVLSFDNYLVITNGHITEQNVNEHFEIKEVDAIDALVSDYVYQSLKHEGNKFEVTNLPERVIFVKVAPKVQETLQIVYVYEGDGKTGEHVIIVNDKFSELNVIENKISIDLEMHQRTTITELFVKAESKVNYTAFQELCEGVENTEHRTAIVERNGFLQLNLSEMNDANTFGNIYTNLVEEGAESETKIVTIANNKQKQLFTVRINHYAPHTIGNIVNHGVVMDHSYAKFDGVGFIPKGSHQSNAQQESRLMILGERGRADANPILLIDEHDVMAGHAATVGQIDEEQLYYLQSRGLSKSDAEKLIVHGFLTPIVEDIENEQLVEQFTKTMIRKLG
jgi:Fe-S cluster assembly protein SufD